MIILNKKVFKYKYVASTPSCVNLVTFEGELKLAYGGFYSPPLLHSAYR